MALTQLEFPIIVSRNIAMDREADGSVTFRPESSDGYTNVETARSMLYGMPKKTIHHLLQANVIKGEQPGKDPDETRKTNHHWRVDIESVLQYKERIKSRRLIS